MQLCTMSNTRNIFFFVNNSVKNTTAKIYGYELLVFPLMQQTKGKKKRKKKGNRKKKTDCDFTFGMRVCLPYAPDFILFLKIIHIFFHFFNQFLI